MDRFSDLLLSIDNLSGKVGAVVLPMTVLKRRYNHLEPNNQEETPFEYLYRVYGKYVLMGVKVDLAKL